MEAPKDVRTPAPVACILVGQVPISALGHDSLSADAFDEDPALNQWGLSGGIRNEKSSKDSLRHLKNLILFHLPSLVSHMAYRSRSIIDAPADAPPDTLARPPCPQVSQWHPRVAKGVF